MTDADIHAFTPVPSAAATLRPRRSVWPWVLLAAALVLLLIVAAGASAVMGLADAAQDGFHVIIDGDEWRPVILASDPGRLAWLGVGAAIVVVLFVVPLVLLLAFVAAGLGVGVAMLAMLLAVALALSPLWLVLLLVWLLLRGKPATRSASATMT